MRVPTFWGFVDNTNIALRAIAGCPLSWRREPETLLMALRAIVGHGNPALR